ncbi:UNVERIFIED_CONTAM: NADP-dependent alkenal double bond reductase P2 [Sesamum radiatum]|uniref:NADP-dependent alkenal double bond reductase P2 n=1 Tax=Sesamum radiatum TaxID=300843 RepID=A0AAW2KS06_SESRA
MEGVKKNKFVCIKHHINGSPEESDFEVKTETIGLSVGSKEVIVKNLYVSVDPYQLNRMKSHCSSQAAISFATAITPGHGIDAYGVGRVVASGRPELAKDELVVGLLTWGEYSIIEEGRLLNKLDPMGLPLPAYVGALGSSGLTAYAGFFKVCNPKKGDKVFVSAACGSVGILVGQYAKLFGCYAVGCAGRKEKVDLLKTKVGFDDAFNYKEEIDLSSTLQRYFPEGIDIYFDNVGGEMLEAAIQNMNNFGRVAICGLISEYTDSQKSAKLDMIRVLYKRIRIEGFLTVDFSEIYQDFISTTTQYLQTSKIKVIEDISCGVESIPEAFLDLFHGNNIGKKVVRIAEDDV